MGPGCPGVGGNCCAADVAHQRLLRTERKGSDLSSILTTDAAVLIVLRWCRAIRTEQVSDCTLDWVKQAAGLRTLAVVG